MPEYEVEITIHETGVVTVEAESARAAMDGIRAGTLSWDQFDQTYEAGNPRVGVRSARLVRPRGE